MKSIRIELEDSIEYKNDHGQFHRLDGPAVEWNGGTKEWWNSGKLHREDGSAVEYFDTTKQWWVNGERHREDGPAIEYSNGDKQYYLNNIQYSEDEFHKEIIKLKLNRIKSL